MSDMNENPIQQPAQQAAPAQPTPSVPAQPAPSASASQKTAPVPPSGQVPPPHAPQAGQMPPMGQMPPAGAMPPSGNVPPQQPYGMPPQPAPAPQNVPGMPLLYLTGGMKFGWAALGFLMGPIAILVAWLTNAHNFPQAKSEAVKFSLIGFGVSLVWWILVVMLFGFTACAALGTMGSAAYYLY